MAPLWGALSHDPVLQWRTLHTANFRIHFHDGEDALARETAQIAESVHQRLSPLLSWQPREPTDIVLTDEIDFANGFTTPLPSNRVELWVTPPDDGLADYGSWLESLILHEYVHVLHLDMVAGTPAAWQRVFGRHPLLFPQALQPAWITEGLATYLETDGSRGVGRGQSSYFQMLMRMEVAGGVKPITQVNQPIRSWPAGVVPYLYGVGFMQFLVQRYGERGLEAWILNYRDNLIPFMINTNSTEVFGKNMTELWGGFTASVQTRYGEQLRAIEAAGVVEGDALTRDGYGTGAVAASDAGSVYYVRDDGGSPPRLMRWSERSGSTDALVELQGDARLDVHSTAGVLVAQPERLRTVRVYYDLYHYSPESGVLRRLTHGARYRFATWSSDGARIAAVHTELGVYSLVLLDAEGRHLDTLWRGERGEVISGLDWSPRAPVLVASLWDAEYGWNLAEFSLESRSWRRLTADKAIVLHPRYSADGEGLVFSADYGGVYNIHHMDLARGTVSTLTNVRGGAFSPALTTTGELFYVGYGAQGYDVFRLDPALPIARPVIEPGPTAVVLPVASLSEAPAVTEYSPATGLAPTWWTPSVAIGDDVTLFGVSTGGADVLRRHIYGLAVGYDFAVDHAVGGFDYVYDRWRPVFELHGARDIAQTRADDGTLRYVSTDDAISLGVTFPWNTWRRRWAVHAGLVWNREQDIYTAPGLASRREKQDNLLGAAVSFDSAQQYPLSISPGFGRTIALVVEDSDLGESLYTGEVYSLDWREYVALGGEQVAALRTVVGWGTDEPRPFQLGGPLSNGAVFSLDGVGLGSPFNHRDYPLRGYADGLSRLTGRRMALASAEWRFPLSRTERGLMAPPVGIDQISGGLFIDSGAAWDEGSQADRYYTGVGAELNLETRWLYFGSAWWTLGYAHGLDREIGEDQVYVRIGGSF